QGPAGAKEDEQCLLIGVSDNGIGIPEEEKEAIFEKFHQVGKPGQGAGLGLALAKELVQLHGGRIWVNSRPGHGSIFFFTLPLREESL
ncbi:MAG: ATP-binding protein, partial [Firmicutes bacterium]|nr:ATP-binding protein [Bacillota bacterium]